MLVDFKKEDLLINKRQSLRGYDKEPLFLSKLVPEGRQINV